MATTAIEATDHASDEVRRRPFLLVLRGVAFGVVIYLGLAWFVPTTFPRPTFLPKPPPGITHRVGCNWETEDWVRSGGFWEQSTWSTLVGCS